MQKSKSPKKVIDFLVSKESFKLNTHPEFGYLVTQPQPTELSKYYESSEYISHTDSNKSFFDRLFQFAKSINLKRKLKLINSISTTDKNLLDVGCGVGDFLKTMVAEKWKVMGIEPNKSAREIATRKTKAHVLEHVDQLSQSLKFDLITLWHVLEHLPNLDQQIEKISSHLAEDGTLVIAVPNYKSFDASYYQEYWAAYDVPRHLWHFDQESFNKLMRHHSFKVIETKPMLFDAYYVSLLSEKYKHGWKNYLRAFFIASRSNLKARTNGEFSSLIYVLKKSK